jgi:hypothetical protein
MAMMIVKRHQIDHNDGKQKLRRTKINKICRLNNAKDIFVEGMNNMNFTTLMINMNNT